jgi:hypothetical protein
MVTLFQQISSSPTNVNLSLPLTCFSNQFPPSAADYTPHTNLPNYLTFSPINTNSTQNLMLNPTSAGTSMGVNKTLNYTNFFKSALFPEFKTDLTLVLYKCSDASNCLTCLFDQVNQILGSSKCTSCSPATHYLNSMTQTCHSHICGDGYVTGNEVCDAGISPGCLSNCSSSAVNFTCSGGTSTTPSICSCVAGTSLIGT